MKLRVAPTFLSPQSEGRRFIDQTNARIRVPSRRYCPANREYASAISRPRQKLFRFKGYEYYAGHYGYCVFEEVNDGHALVTNFRNPVSRIFSLYNFWRKNVPESYLEQMLEVDAAPVREARTKSFSEFIRSENPNLRLYMDNAHYRQILDTWYVDRAPIWSDFTKVLKRIIGMKWFFVTEFSGLSQVALRRAFPEAGFSNIPVTNESRDKQSQDSPSGKDVIYLIRRNSVDFAIYVFAVALLIWRIRPGSR